jgi:ABC-type uncharacterized transport system ATPase component
MSTNMCQRTLRTGVPAVTVEIRPVFILVMGLTGAGKSTFISVVTGNEDIPIGTDAQLDGGMPLLLVFRCEFSKHLKLIHS